MLEKRGAGYINPREGVAKLSKFQAQCATEKLRE